MVLMIDNYDSFTYNLVQYLGELDQDLVVRRNDKTTPQEVRDLGPQGIVISPGPGRPEDAGVSVELVKEFAGEIPILGVCLGHQAAAAAFGGRIIAAGALPGRKPGMRASRASSLRFLLKACSSSSLDTSTASLTVFPSRSLRVVFTRVLSLNVVQDY